MKAKSIIYSLLDFMLTFGGAGAVVVYNYITPTNTFGFKLTLTGILLLVIMVLTAKAMFEKNYRKKYDTLLQQLANATDIELKQAISQKLDAHKKANDIYNRLMLLLPFAILYIVTLLGSIALKDLSGSIGIILATMGAGSFFNIAKKPIKEELALQKIKNKIKK